MRAILLLILVPGFLLPVLANAEVYRWVDDDGNVHFGDSPPEERRSEPVEIREPTRAVPLEGAREILQRPVRPEAVDPEGYERIEIARPQDDEGVRANDGMVTVEVALEPGLASDHRIVWLLDGDVVEETTSTSTTLGPLERGRFGLEARVVDEEDVEQIASERIEFNVLRFSIPREQQRQERPQQFPQVPQPPQSGD